MKYPKTVLWFVALICISIGVGMKVDVASGFLVLGITTIISLVIYVMFDGSVLDAD